MGKYVQIHQVNDILLICYACDNVDKLSEELTANNWTPLFKPVEAPALGNRKICYFFNAEIGFMELVNKK